MSALLHFILVFITEIIFHFHGGHEQFHKGYCFWNISLLPPAFENFIGIIASSIPTFLHFILVSIIEIIFYFHGIHEQFHIGYCVWYVSLFNPARQDFIGIIPFSIPIFLHFILVSIAETVYFHGIHGQYHIGCLVWNVSLLQSARKVFLEIIPFPILVFLDFLLVSIFHFMVVMSILIYNTLS